jgi:hypothetical protein
VPKLSPGSNNRGAQDGTLVTYSVAFSQGLESQSAGWLSNGDVYLSVSDGTFLLVKGRTAYVCAPSVSDLSNSLSGNQYSAPATPRVCAQFPNLTSDQASAFSQLFVITYQHPLGHGGAFSLVVPTSMPAGQRLIHGIKSACVIGSSVLSPESTTVCTATSGGFLTFASASAGRPSYTLKSRTVALSSMFVLPTGVHVLSAEESKTVAHGS